MRAMVVVGMAVSILFATAAGAMGQGSKKVRPKDPDADVVPDPVPVKPKTDAEKKADAEAGLALVTGSFACMVVTALASLFIYFIPSMVAVMRGHPNTAPILTVNIFLGWTLIGFVVALAWAFTAVDTARSRPRYYSD